VIDLIRSMQIYVAVCDLQGLASAARRLGLAPSVVTRTINALEQELGVRLLNRTTRSISQTDAGSRFLERARRILADVEEARVSAQQEQGRPRGRLSVSAPLLFGRMHVGPVASGFLDVYPEVTMELNLSDRYVNLVEEGVDLAIRIGALEDSALIARRIGETRRVLVASPDYLMAHGTPSRPHDLRGHQLIAFQAGERERNWSFADGSQINAGTTAQFLTNSGEAAIDHTLRGGGIAAVFSYQVTSELSGGRLTEVLREFASPSVPIQAVFATTRLLSAKVRAFIDLIDRSSSQWTAQ
jgi:DNA-binding transcriptional LysR family regulator